MINEIFISKEHNITGRLSDQEKGIHKLRIPTTHFYLDELSSENEDFVLRTASDFVYFSECWLSILDEDKIEYRIDADKIFITHDKAENGEWWIYFQNLQQITITNHNYNNH